MRNNTTKIDHPKKSGTLVRSNAYLRSKKAGSIRIRSLASSTAIETGEAIEAIESKLRKGNFSKHRLNLA